METYLQQIEAKFERLPPSIRARLEGGFSTQKRLRGEFLLREGQYCRHIFWVVSGIARSFVLHDGCEVTTNFAFPNDFILSLQSAALGVPSRESIQIVRAGEVAAVDTANFKKLTGQHPELAELDTMLSDYYAMQLENRLLDLQTLTAKARYQKLLLQQPHLLAEISLTHLASYLGISLETLSRIRAKA